jgi:hypothetical protein
MEYELAELKYEDRIIEFSNLNSTINSHQKKDCKKSY